ncbi:MAG: prepilin-type N-terminal cleavage/methylation domain-containing protein [Desulfuromonas sp.]|nr:prepilin-type N-terminal cleavage/methylation domain-containing protein [Desulfuromonas sp.]
MPMYKIGRSNNHGFTLIELTIVMFLLSLFAVISVPIFSSVGENNLQHSARRIGGMVKYLYNEAALTATPHRLVFDIEKGECTPQQNADGQEWTALESTVRSYHLPGDVRITKVWIDGRGELSTGTATIEFHPQGWLPATTLHLQQGKKDTDKQLSINLLPFTGNAEILDGYHEFE